MCQNESDIDILVVGEKPKKTYGKLQDLQADTGLKYNAAFSVIMKTVKEFQNEWKPGSPFIEDVVKEGEFLYQKNFDTQNFNS